MNIISIIPARGGSKSIPRKNIKIIGGVPLLKYSIDYSLNCKMVNRTVVSTEDKEISKYAVKFKSEVLKRPKSLAKDSTPDFPVIKHALFALEKKYQEKIDFLILLRPTSPLRPKKLIEKGIKLLLKNSKATSVRAVSEVKQHPYRMWKKNNKYISSIDDNHFKIKEPYNKPRQNLPKVFFQTGDIEIIRRSTVIEGSVSGNRIMPIYISHDAVFDIDNPIDLIEVEKKIKYHE